jgi:hypothetical protein
MTNRQDKMHLGIPRQALRRAACWLGVLTLSLTTAAALPDSTDTTALTINGSAKIVTAPQGKSVLWLTPALGNQTGSAFTTNSIAFQPDYRFSTFFQFRMANTGGIGAGDGLAFVLQTQSATALGSGGNVGIAVAPSQFQACNTSRGRECRMCCKQLRGF